MCTFNASKVTFIQLLFEWQIGCSFRRKTVGTDVKFLDGSVFKNLIPNGISVFRTSLFHIHIDVPTSDEIQISN